MDNHVHLIGVPEREQSLSSVVGQAHHLYSQAHNLHWKHTGHVWEHKFYSCPMDEDHLVRALIYVDSNPVRAGLVKTPTEWMWSSARFHAGGDDILGLVDPKEWTRWSRKIQWSDKSPQSDMEASIEVLRHHTRNGCPLGNDDFMDALETRLGYPVRRKSPGRPLSSKPASIDINPKQ